MIPLCLAAAVVSPGTDPYTYWGAIANAVTFLRSVELKLAPDEKVPKVDDPGEFNGYYHVPEWLLEAYALALYPDVGLIPIEDYDIWVEYHPEAEEHWWVRQNAAETGYWWPEYKSMKQNPDGTWDVTITLSGAYDDEAVPFDKVVTLAPNAAYNPDSPFEYHVAQWPDWPESDDDGPTAPENPPPDFIVGTWRAPVKSGHVAWLEIFSDGMAGLYLGPDDYDELFEIYSGTVTAGNESEYAVNAVMDFHLNWYIYETGDGTPVTGVPDSYKGSYGLSCDWEGDQRVLYVVVDEIMDENTDPLFGKSNLKMLWVPKTCGGGSMVDMEAFG